MGAIRPPCRSSGTLFGLCTAVYAGQIALKRDSAHSLMFYHIGAKFHPDLLGARRPPILP